MSGFDGHVWVGCVACYHGGRLVGQWVPALGALDVSASELHHEERVPFYTARGTMEGLWCFDVEDDTGLIRGEVSPMEAVRLARIAEAIEEDGFPVRAVVAWRDNGNKLDEWDGPTRDAFNDAFQGEFGSEEEFAYHLAGELGVMPADQDWPASYIDWERATRDLFASDYWSAPAPGGVYVFREC